MTAILFLVAANDGLSGWAQVVLAVFALLALSGFLQRVMTAIETWREEAAQLGLHFSGGVFAKRQLSGRIQGYSIHVENFTSDRTTWTRLKLDCADRIPGGIQLTAERPWLGVTKALIGEDVQIGDGEFDAAVNVSGPEPIAVAFLGQEARTSIRELIAAGGSVQQGCIRLDIKGDMSGRGEIRRAVEWLLELVSGLPHGTVLQRHCANATGDRYPGVRLRNLRLLAEKFRATEEAKSAALAALADPEPAVRLFAATFVKGGQGLAVLKALLEDADISDDLRADAVRAAGASRDPSLLGAVYALVPRRDPALAEAVAAALGQFGGADAEHSLLRLMSRDAMEVKRAAATALGLLGTVSAVEPLLQLAREGPLKEIARDAVRRIQARLGGEAEAGRLSIAAQDAAAGGLSIAADGGELSVAPDETSSGSASEGAPAPRDRLKG